MPINTFPARFRSSIRLMAGSTCGTWLGFLHPGDLRRQKQWILRHQPKLDGGQIEKLVRLLRSIDAPSPSLAETIRIEAAYFERNAERKRYPEFRRQHLFVGSGVIEAGCKTVIGSRLKQSGMFWTVTGANSIIALRCCYLNDRFEDSGESQSAAQRYK